jgi:type IV pilus assembly protein PilA
MIVIAILGILASIAISAYQDYTIRSKVAEATQVVSPFTTAIGTYYWTNSAFPVNRTASGQSDVITKYISGVTITSRGAIDGIISVDINEDSTGISTRTASDMYLLLTPEVTQGAIDWVCSVNTSVNGSGDNLIISRFVATSCRN